jgi:hypothetical protein
MSSYKRGLYQGLVHYCHSDGALWCKSAPPPDRPKGEPTKNKRELVTCLLCLGIRLRL